MSDYSDYGVHPEIEALVADHEEMRRLAAELMTAVREEPIPTATVTARLDQLGIVLDRHTAREETGLFATLRRVAVGDDYLARFHHDHGDLLAGLAAARTDHTRVLDLVGRLEAHFLVEENDMFHGAHQLLSAEDWEEVERTAVAG